MKMRTLRWCLPALAAALMLAGCGESSSEAEVAKIRFESEAVLPDGEISPSYECGFGSMWLPLKWGPVPAGTEELVVYFGRYIEDETAGSPKFKVPFGILLTEISPTVRGIEANTLPEGTVPVAYKSSNSCPSARTGQSIVLQLFALDGEHQVSEEGQTSAALDAESTAQLTEDALGIEPSGELSELATTLTEESLGSGSFTATYGSPSAD
jgi:hypothetical protein